MTCSPGKKPRAAYANHLIVCYLPVCAYKYIYLSYTSNLLGLCPALAVFVFSVQKLGSGNTFHSDFCYHVFE